MDWKYRDLEDEYTDPIYKIKTIKTRHLPGQKILKLNKVIIAIVIISILGFAIFMIIKHTQIFLPPFTGTVSITGTPQVGQTLTANTGNLSGSGTISYQWQRGNLSVGTNSRTYTLTNADLGSNITVTVTRSDNSGSISSNRTATVTSAPPPVLTGTVRITGTNQVGQTLTANTNNLGGSGTISYQWRRGNTNIGSNRNTYVLTTADVNSNITVIVSRSNNSGDITSDRVIVAAAPVATPPTLTGTVSISQTAQVGQTLTANTNNLGGSGIITYQWRRGNIDIGTNSSTYIVQQADVGSNITVIVTRSNNSGIISSNQTATVTSVPAPTLTGSVRITGTAQVGHTLTANTNNLRGSGAITFQWRRGNTDIGTNSSTYIVQQADVGSNITVIVTRSNNSGIITSSQTALVTSIPQENQRDNYVPIGDWDFSPPPVDQRDNYVPVGDW